MPELIRAVEALQWRYGGGVRRWVRAWVRGYVLMQVGCRLPTAVQAEAIPLALGGGDLLVVRAQGHRHARRRAERELTCMCAACGVRAQAAETGSGKTGVRGGLSLRAVRHTVLSASGRVGSQAFCLPIVQIAYESLRTMAAAAAAPQAAGSDGVWGRRRARRAR
jgi:hypothetical protein